MIMNEHYIYGLSHPDESDKILYIGKTMKKYGPARLNFHIYESRISKKNNPKLNWIRSILKDNKRPVFTIIEVCSNDEWQHKEKGYIKLFKSFGANLVNSTIGGNIYPQIKGKGHHFYGKIGPNCINFGRRKSYKIREIKRGIYTSSKPVCMIDINNDKVIKTFWSVKDAACYIKGVTSPIVNVCNGRRHTYYGYKWKYSSIPIFKILQINKKSNKVINKFVSIIEAERKTGINKDNINNVCKRTRRITAGGFKWKYNIKERR